MTIEAAELMARVRADLTGLEKEMARAETIVQNAGKGMEAKGNQAGQGVGRGIQQGLGMMLGPGAGMLLGGAVIGGGAGLLAKEIMGEVGALNDLGMQSQRLGTAFVTLWGEQAPAAMDKLRRASLGAISDMDLQLAANRASMLQVTQDADELAGLLEVAQYRGRAMGISSAQAFNDIVTGIGRLSPMLLDNLGIITEAEATYNAYAATLGKTGKELTDVEKRQALVNKVLAEERSLAMDAAGNAEALAAAKANLREQIGLAITDMVTETGAVDTLTKAYQGLAEAMQREHGRTVEGRELSGGFEDTFARSLGQLSEQDYILFKRSFDQLKSALRDGRIDADEFGARIAELEDNLRLVTGQMLLAEIATLDKAEADLRAERAMRAAKLAGKDMIKPLAHLEDQFISNTDAALAFAGAMREAIGLMAGPIPSARFLGTVAGRDPSADYMTIDTSAGAGLFEGGDAGVKRTVGQLSDKREEENRAYQESLRSAKSYYSDAQRLAEQHYREMRGLVEGQLSLTSVTREDMLATQLGIYQDKPDEYLRRLRSAVQDEKSAWKDLLGGRSGAEAEYYLMQQEQAFQQGRWGEMGPGFDRTAAIDTVVANVRAQIEAERTRAALIDEIMQHPDISGAGLSRNEIAVMAGLPADYQELGAERGAALAQGITEVGAGVQFTTQFQEEFTATRQQWVDMGVLSVAWLAQGIEKGATPDVAALLVRLLAPMVEDALASGRRP